MNVIEEIRKFGFPEGHYIVIGSAIMDLKGIRPAKDLDFVVTQELFDKCRAEGWELKPWDIIGKKGREWLKKGTTELMLQLGFDDDIHDANKLLQEAEIIEGIPFMNLKNLARFKIEYGRPKDLDDVRLIEDYLKSNEQKYILGSVIPNC